MLPEIMQMSLATAMSVHGWNSPGAAYPLCVSVWYSRNNGHEMKTNQGNSLSSR